MVLTAFQESSGKWRQDVSGGTSGVDNTTAVLPKY
jgi:hypothetical protein